MKRCAREFVMYLFLVTSISFMMLGRSSNMGADGRIPRVSSITGSLPPAAGTWIINQNTTVEGETLLLNGSINVLTGFKLEIIDSFLDFSIISSSISGTGATLVVINSTITNYSQIIFSSNSLVEVQDSTLSNFESGTQVDGSGLHVENTTFTGGDIGIKAHSFSGISIQNSSFLDLKNESIGLSFGNGAIVEDCYMRGGGDTYDCIGVATYQVVNLSVNGTTMVNYHKSIFYQNSSFCNLTNSYFAQSPDSQFSDGELQFDAGCSDVMLINNTINNLTWDGIEIYRSSNFLIKNNTIKFTGSGTHIEHGLISNISLVSNTFINSDLRANDVVHLNITSNSFYSCGIQVRNCSTVVIWWNDICKGKISVTGSTNVDAGEIRILAEESRGTLVASLLLRRLPGFSLPLQ
ncbi:MAG: right-handed parallel beta-helix repeat-containing protein [Promethearchaeota archaeon]